MSQFADLSIAESKAIDASCVAIVDVRAGSTVICGFDKQALPEMETCTPRQWDEIREARAKLGRVLNEDDLRAILAQRGENRDD